VERGNANGQRTDAEGDRIVEVADEGGTNRNSRSTASKMIENVDTQQIA
jgi:hypothetical protein